MEIRPQYPELLAALKDCDFRSLVKEIEAEATQAAPVPAQGELF
jgi:hypothetical protein